MINNRRQIGLALFRIIMCFLIVRSMFLYFPYAEILFGQDGIASYDRYVEYLKDSGLQFLQYPFNEEWPARTYLWIVIFLALTYSMGIGKWITGCMLYFAIINLQLRNHLVLDGSDNVIIVTLPLLIFADAYRHLSYNLPSFRFEKHKYALYIRQAFTFLLLAQICIIYFVTGIVKAGADVWQTGLANYYILQLDEFMGSKWNLLLAKNELFVKTTTYMTLVFEILFPFAILHKTTKYVWLGMGVLFHVGIWVFMKIDVFPWIMIATYFLFITDKEYKLFFQWLSHKAGRYLASYNFNKYAPVISILLIFNIPTANAQSDQSEIFQDINSLLNQDIAPGLAVGFVFGNEDTLIEKGVEGYTLGRSVDSHSLFEIGSITKTFTTLLLAMEARKGHLRLNDRIGQYIATDTDYEAANITFEELATHSSGLSVNPKGIKRWKADPTVGMDSSLLVEDLLKANLSKRRVKKVRYSNFGIAVLGMSLSAFWKDAYSDKLDELIFETLNMNNAAVLPLADSVDTQLRIAQGHNKKGTEVKHWEFNAYGPSGGIIASSADMLSYLNFCVDVHEIDESLEDIWLSPRIESGDDKVSLGWFIEPVSEEYQLYWHNGMTNGFSSYIGFIPGLNVGVFVLSNSETSVDELARQLLNNVIKLRHLNIKK